MAGSAEILQEYLVSLGYKTDVVSLKKFESGIGVTGKRILKVAGAVAGVVTAVEAAAAAFAYSMRKVYFQSELSNTSVKNLKALAFAGKQFGIEAGAMEGAIHSMAQVMRLNPGMTGFLSSLTGINQEGKQASEQVLDLIKATKSMPEYIGAQYAAQFGMDADTYHQLREHYDEIIEKQKQLKQAYKDAGFDPDDPKNKKAIMEYTASIDELAAKLGLLSDTALAKMAPSFKSMTETVSNGLTYWTRWLNGAESVSKTLKEIYKYGSWKSFGKFLISDVYDADDERIKKMLNEPVRLKQKGPSGTFASGAENKSFDRSQLPNVKGGRSLSAIDVFQRYGWTKEQAAGIVANLQAESAFNPQAVGDSGKAYGIAQWHPDRQANFKKWSGKDIRNSTLEEQMAFVNYELTQGSEKAAGERLRKTRNAKEAGEVVSQYYERPADKVGQAALRGAAAARLGADSRSNVVTLNSATTINVNGGDARSTAALVAGKQKDVASNIVRDVKGSLL